MHDVPITNIIRTARLISPTDSVARAAEALRVSGLTELPVVAGGRVVGMITEALVLYAFTSGDPKEAMQRPVSEVMSNRVVAIGAYVTVGQAGDVMRDHDRQVLPVMDEYGVYRGIVARPDIYSVLCLTIRPPTVAGLATPLGVYLTTGYLRAGVGNLGLFLAGVVMIVTWFAAQALVYGLAWVVGLVTPLELLSILQSPPAGLSHWLGVIRSAMIVAQLPAFMLLFRLLPVTGYHAAEHQVVHAIENGEPLVPDIVRAMPRAHPRCGTNLVVGVMLFLAVAERFSPEVAVLLTVFVILFAWRTIGGYVQYYITTKPASDKQLANGIRAGESLLEKYRERPGYRGTEWQRIWNTGMPMVMLGVAAVLPIQYLLHNAWPGLF